MEPRLLLAARDAVRFDPISRRPLLDGANLEIGAGDRILLHGSSGSGKTLLLRALALLDPLQKGEIRWREEPIADREVPGFRSRAVYLQQRPTLVAGTVEHNLLLPASFSCHRELQLDRARALPLLRQLERTEGFLAQRSDDLSGGERQIVAFLRALLLEPTVLLLDEPTAALDPATARTLGELIDAWFAERETERAYLWVRHGESPGQRRETRRLRMEVGRLVEES